MIDRSRTNAFEFVVVAGARAKQLMRGCTPRTTAATSSGSPRARSKGERAARRSMRAGAEGSPRRQSRDKWPLRPTEDPVSLVALGVTGGIGAYKAVEIARELQKRDHEVVAIMTRSARKFVGEVTFEAITRRRVITDQFAPGANADIEHIALATDIALLLVAPATANMIGKFANGIADDFLSSLYLATRAPVLMAPAMNTQHAGARRRPPQHGDAGGARRAFCRPGRRVSGLRLDRQGPPRGARRHRGGGRPAAAAEGDAPRPFRARHGRSYLRGHRRRQIHRQSIERQHGIRHCGRGGAAAARGSCSSRVRRASILLPVSS